MFGSIAQSTQEDRLVITVDLNWNTSGSTTFTWFDIETHNDEAWLSYRFEKVGAPDVIGSGTFTGAPINTPIEFPSTGEYKIFFRPLLSNYSSYLNRMRPYANNVSQAERDKLKEINNWGRYPFYYSLNRAFYFCNNLDITATDCPLLYGSTDNATNVNISEFFRNAVNVSNENGSLGNWDISRVNSLVSTFMLAKNLSNEVALNKWYTSNVASISTTFYGCPWSGSLASSLVTNNGRTYIAWDTSNITTMNETFLGLNGSDSRLWGGKITGIGNWNTSNLISMYGAFRGQSGTYSRTSSFNEDINTKEVTIAAGTPYETTYNAWDVSKVTRFGQTANGRWYQGPFFGSAFNQPLNKWQINTGSAVSMQGIFGSVPNFNQPISQSTVTVGTGDNEKTYEAWNVKAVNNFSYAFHNIAYNSRTSSFNQDISGWDMSGATNLSQMFWRNTTFTGSVSTWNISNVTNIGSMFRGANAWMNKQYSLSSSYQNHPTRGEYIAWDTNNVTNMFGVFQNEISAYASIGSVASPGYDGDITNWNTSKVTDMRSMFNGTSAITSSFNQDISTKEVTIGAGRSIETTYNAWDVSSVNRWGPNNTNSETYPPGREGTFYNNKSFNQDISNWQIATGSGDVWMQGMFRGASAFDQPLNTNTVEVGSKIYEAWNTKKVITLRNTFYGATNFNQPLNDWNTNAVTTYFYTFYSANKFNQPLNKWETTPSTNMNGMFQNTNMTYDLSSSYQPATSGRSEYIAWDTSNVTNMFKMFHNGVNTTSPYQGYNGNIYNWNTSNVANIGGMFSGTGTQTSSFNQNINTKEVTIGAETSIGTTYNAWDVSSVTFFGRDLTNTGFSGYYQESLFYNNPHFNQPLGNWQINTGSGLNLSLRGMFQGASSFNQDISSSIVTVGSKTYRAWDTSRVSMTMFMFDAARNFNKPIGNWDMTNNKYTAYMFRNADVFNQDISASIQTVGSDTYNAWYTPDNTSMFQMFNSADNFSKPIQNWEIGNVTNFSNTFSTTGLINQSFATQSVSLNGGVSYKSWDIGSKFLTSTTGSNMNDMFNNSNDFGGVGLGTWNVSKVYTFGDTFANLTNISTETYDEILISWSSSLNSGNFTVTQISFGNAKYTGGSTAAGAHEFIEDNLGITLTDGGTV
tara:strand:+ start:634 stop:4059 length:3426 start_codon:yes stop_codon:yes gene_type:complete